MSKSIAKFVKSQFPKYILETDSMFPYFMEAYYEWMSHQTNPNGLVYDLDGIANVDDKYSNFVDEFISEYIDVIPENIATDKQLLIKKVNELYQTKGTNKSIKLLFRILYDLDVTVIDPSENIFKASAATYVKPKAIRFNITSGAISTYKDVTFSISEKVFKFDYVRKIGDNLYEGILQDNFIEDISSGFVLKTSEYEATPVKTITKKKILTKGSGFKVGDIFEISTTDGTGTKIKITRVDNTGIRGFDIIKFGGGYLTDFNYRLSATTLLSVTESRNLTLTKGSEVNQYTSPDSVNKLVDDYKISKFTYLQSLDYLADNSYVGDLIKTGQTEISGNQLESSDNDAEILFTLGYLYEYPGYYATNEGIVSDTSKLHDGEYWQQYSYVIRADKQYNEYKDIVKKLVHPAGLRMFGEYTINNKIDLLIDIKTFIDTFNSIVVDSSQISDQIERKDFIKNIIYNSFEVDTTGNGDTLLINTSNDELDSGSGYEKFNVLEQIYFTLQREAIPENVNITENILSTFTKNLSELQNITEQLYNTLTKYLSDDTVTTFDLLSKTITKNIMVRSLYNFEYTYDAEILAMSSADMLNTGTGDIFGIENTTDPLQLENTLESIMMSETDTLDLGDGSTFSTYAGMYIEPDETYANLAANIVYDLDIGGGLTLAIPNTSYVIPSDNDILISDEEEIDSFRVRTIGGVILNPYYSPTELINNNIPYWQYGYTKNERIIQ